MRNVIHLDPEMVPAALRGSYNGKTFKAIVTESVTIPVTAGLWEGGSRDLYSVVSLDHGTREIPGQRLAPWSPGRGDHTVELLPGIVVVEHSIFCGKDMGLTFYVHPENATKLLPAPAAELTRLERVVLEATRSYKSSYAGMDRFQMAHRDYAGKFAFTRSEWDMAKAHLVELGMLNKAGAITNKGRNAIAR